MASIASDLHRVEAEGGALRMSVVDDASDNTLDEDRPLKKPVTPDGSPVSFHVESTEARADERSVVSNDGDDEDELSAEESRAQASPLQSMSCSSATSVGEDSDSSTLREENKRLRLEISMLRNEIRRFSLGAAGSTLSSTKHVSYESSVTSKSPEFSKPIHASLRAAAEAQNPRWARSRKLTASPLSLPPEDIDSEFPVSTNDEGSQQFTDRPDSEAVEMHTSGKGLHHRRITGIQRRPLEIIKGSRGGRNYQTVSQGDEVGSGHIEDDDAQVPDDDVENQVGVQNENHDINNRSFCAAVKDRAGWLVGLLVLQSMSSFIISRNEDLLQAHLVIVQFLTMLVGAGGNAGNQASVRVIRGLATGSIHRDNVRYFLLDELKMGFTLSAILGVTGCIRALVFLVPLAETIAITTSLCTIVFISILIGALLPLGMRKVRIDPAHSSTTIQVLMDILGVTITVCK